MPYTHQIKVAREDIDQMGHVNNVVYVRYVQEVAEAHWKHIAPQTLQKDIAWVVLRHEIDYKAPAFFGEILTAETWVEPNNGPRMPRWVVIKNTDGKEIVKARTTWCALNGRTHRPIRISKETYQRFT